MAEPQKPIPGQVNHALRQQRVGFYSVFLPAGYEAQTTRFYPVCFLLHDRDSSEQVVARQTLAFLPKDKAIFVAPRAPHTSEALPDAHGVWPASFQQFNQPGFPKDDLKALRIPHLQTEWIASCLKDVRERYRTDNERVIAIGHGEGGTYSHVLAYHHPELLRAYVSHGGGPFDIPPDRVKMSQILRQHRIVPFLAHNLGDPAFRSSNSVALAGTYAQSELEHRTCFQEANNHDFSPAVLHAVSQFLLDYL